MVQPCFGGEVVEGSRLILGDIFMVDIAIGLKGMLQVCYFQFSVLNTSSQAKILPIIIKDSILEGLWMICSKLPHSPTACSPLAS